MIDGYLVHLDVEALRFALRQILLYPDKGREILIDCIVEWDKMYRL